MVGFVVIAVVADAVVVCGAGVVVVVEAASSVAGWHGLDAAMPQQAQVLSDAVCVAKTAAKADRC